MGNSRVLSGSSESVGSSTQGHMSDGSLATDSEATFWAKYSSRAFPPQQSIVEMTTGGAVTTLGVMTHMLLSETVTVAASPLHWLNSAGEPLCAGTSPKLCGIGQDIAIEGNGGGLVIVG